MGNFPDKNSGGDLFTLMYRLDATGLSRKEIEEYIANLPDPESNYTEGILVGYRWFDTKEVPVMYAFGHGLSYVGFECRPDTKIERAIKELEAFERITLKAGETKRVTMEFPISELAHWDMETNGWVLEPGRIEILVGSSSDDIRQTYVLGCCLGFLSGHYTPAHCSH